MADDQYQFCGFFSYKRDDDTNAWHDEVRRRLRTYIRLEIQIPTAELFFDVDGIETGRHFEDVLQKALAVSPILIASFSSSYFASPFCRAEFETFTTRERHCGCPPGTLIAPVMIHRPYHTPDWAAGFQVRDFSDYQVDLPSFWASPSALEFVRELKMLAQDIGNKIKNHMPPFSRDFPVLQAPDDLAPVPSGIAIAAQPDIDRPYAGGRRAA